MPDLKLNKLPDRISVKMTDQSAAGPPQSAAGLRPALPGDLWPVRDHW
jgi:hypothetical protein